MEAIYQQIVEGKKNERANVLNEVKRLCKEFFLTSCKLKGLLIEGKKSDEKINIDENFNANNEYNLAQNKFVQV